MAVHDRPSCGARGAARPLETRRRATRAARERPLAGGAGRAVRAHSSGARGGRRASATRAGRARVDVDPGPQRARHRTCAGRERRHSAPARLSSARTRARGRERIRAARSRCPPPFPCRPRDSALAGSPSARAGKRELDRGQRDAREACPGARGRRARGRARRGRRAERRAGATALRPADGDPVLEAARADHASHAWAHRNLRARVGQPGASDRTWRSAGGARARQLRGHVGGWVEPLSVGTRR